MESKIRLLIIDIDKEYVATLVSYISDRHANEFIIASVSDVKKLTRLIKSGYQTDLVIITSTFFKELDERTESDLMYIANGFLILNPGKRKSAKLQNFWGPVGGTAKYQDAELIIQELLSLDKEVIQFTPLENAIKGVGSIGIYSPIGGSGKSFLAYFIAKSLSNMKKKILLQSFEDVESLSFYISNNLPQSLNSADLYLSLKTGIGVIEERLKECIFQVHDLDILLPAGAVSEACQLNNEEIFKFLLLEKEKLNYQCIVSDLGAWTAIESIKILEAQDLVIVPARNDGSSIEKLRRWVKFIKAYSNGDCEGVIKKCICVFSGRVSNEILLELKGEGFEDVVCAPVLSGVDDENGKEFLIKILR